MKRIAAILLLALPLAGCDVDVSPPASRLPPPACPDGRCPAPNWNRAPAEVPAMDLPLAMREHNWGGGSCVHASTVMCLRWQHQEEWAAFWRTHYSGGESLGGLVDKLEKNGLRYAYTNGDESFLDWCSRTRRGAVIFYFPNHSICFVGHHDGQAWLLDNNREDHFLRVPWDEFVRNWKGYGGVALTPIYVPPPPQPLVAARSPSVQISAD
jgi:hypothetical protein